MKRLWLLSLVIAIMACYNAPTPPSEIGGAHMSGFHYENRDCESLLGEIKFLEKELSIPIKIVSVGPDRKETIYR